MMMAPTPEEAEAYRATPQFNVSLVKLVVMSLCTFGLYELYWCYQQWEAIRRREGENLSPFWRAFFGPLWSFKLFPRLQALTGKHGVPAGWSGGGLALGWLLIHALWRLPDPWWLASLLSFLPLLAVQQSINTLNAVAAPDADRNSSYSGKNVLIILLGSIFLLLVLWGTFLPGPEAEVAPRARKVDV